MMGFEVWLKATNLKVQEVESKAKEVEEKIIVAKVVAQATKAEAA